MKGTDGKRECWEITAMTMVRDGGGKWHQGGEGRKWTAFRDILIFFKGFFDMSGCGM
jgi:hypothetical protein